MRAHFSYLCKLFLSLILFNIERINEKLHAPNRLLSSETEQEEVKS